MSSKSNEQVETSTTSVAMDRRTVVERGQAIVDSVVSANDPEVIDAALRPLLAAWDTQATSGTLNLVEITSLGAKLIEMVDKSQINIGENAQAILREGMEGFEVLAEQNRLTVQLVDDFAERAQGLTERNLELIAEVKTADFSELSKQ